MAVTNLLMAWNISPALCVSALLVDFGCSGAGWAEALFLPLLLGSLGSPSPSLPLSLSFSLFFIASADAAAAIACAEVVMISCARLSSWAKISRTAALHESHTTPTMCCSIAGEIPVPLSLAPCIMIEAEEGSGEVVPGTVLIGGKGKVRMVVVRESRASWGRVCCGEDEQIGQLTSARKSRNDRASGAKTPSVRGVLEPGFGSKPCWVNRPRIWGTSGI